MSASDVALVARVQRPVVTMWRSRFREGPDTFPAAVDGGRFDADQVVDWLSAHGKGNNPHPELLLPALKLMGQARDDAGRAAELSAVFALRAAYGDALIEALEAPTGVAEVLAAAEGLDALACFAGEVSALLDLPADAGAVEAFLDERFGFADAMRWLTDECLVKQVPAFRSAALAPEPARLIARAAVAVAESAMAPGVADASGTGFAWLDRLPSDWPGRVGVVADESPVGRHTRRMVQMTTVGAERLDGDLGWPVAVHVAADATLEQILTSAALRDDAQTRLVVGSARYLADPLGSSTLQRDDLLRDGVVRAVVKLPAGCRPSNPRQALALWVVAERDDVPFEQQRTFVCDLTGVDLSPRLTADLATDLRAAALDPITQQHRAWRVLRPVLTRHLLARGGSLVASGALAATTGRGTLVDPVRLADAAQAVGLTDLPAMAAGPGTGSGHVTVAAAVTAGWLTALPGTRLPVADLAPGDLPVWAVEEGHLVRGVGLDRLAALARHRTWVTQPGDVVVGPGPRAAVDSVGGALVAFPARAYRLAPSAPTTPRQLCRAIAAAPRGTKAPQWSLPLLDEGQRQPLSGVTDKIERRRAELRAQLDALDSFEDTLLDACEHRHIALEAHS